MKLNVKLQTVFLKIVSFLYIVLFTYASISKLIDFENFQTQLGQSPLLSSYAHYISFLAIIVILGLVLALSLPVSRIKALYEIIAHQIVKYTFDTPMMFQFKK